MAFARYIFDGSTPTKYNGTSQYQKGLATSNLDLDGKQPLAYDQQSNYLTDLGRF